MDLTNLYDSSSKSTSDRIIFKYIFSVNSSNKQEMDSKLHYVLRIKTVELIILNHKKTRRQLSLVELEV